MEIKHTNEMKKWASAVKIRNPNFKIEIKVKILIKILEIFYPKCEKTTLDCC